MPNHGAKYVVTSGIGGCRFDNLQCRLRRQSSRHDYSRWRKIRYFADDIFKYICLNENVSIPITISLKFIPKGPINNIPTLVQIMGWCRPGDKPLSAPMMVSLPMHIYI